MYSVRLVTPPDVYLSYPPSLSLSGFAPIEYAPRFCILRSVPVSLKPALEVDWSRLELLGVKQPVEYSDWAAP